MRLVVTEWVVGWARWYVEAGWCSALHMSRHTGRSLLFLRWWSKARTALTRASHDALKEVRWAVADCWWWWLRRSGVWAGWCASALFELVTKACYFLFVSKLSQLVV